MNILGVIGPFVLIGLCSSYGDWKQEIDARVLEDSREIDA